MSAMRDFWDARAREDAVHFVDTREPYGEGDLRRFFANGERDLDTLLTALGVVVRADADVLDIGCGLGRLTRPLASRARRVTGLDVSPEMLERARGLHRDLTNVTWLLGDGTSLAGIPDASLDGAVSHVVFQHLPRPELTLGYVAELGRVLRPGGWFAVGLSTDPAVHRRRVGDLLRPQRRPEWRGSAVALDDLERTADAAGLAIEHVAGPGSQYTLVRGSRAAGST
jgi:SAM-dependent methyltransferase